MTQIAHPELDGIGKYEYGWSDKTDAGSNSRRGLNEEVVRDISSKKNEPQWMLDLRLKGLNLFDKKPMPSWGSDLSGIFFDTIKYFVRSTEKQATSWEDLPDDIKNTYDRLGIPEAEKKRLVAGVAAQYESEVVYHSIREDLEAQGVLFLDTDTALREHEDIFKEYFGTVIPVGDNKFAALNTSVWSGGSFVYIPKGVHVEIPLQAYFRINTENMGQFERTLISGNSKFDRFLRGETTLTPEEENGFNVFMDEAKGDCFHCHGSNNNPLWTDNLFHNNGLDKTFSDLGLGAKTGDPKDNGKFKSPSIRNLAFTAPYMHDGRFTTLEEVINHYSEGLQFSSTIDPLMKKVSQGGVQLSAKDKADLKAFLLSLSEVEFINNPSFKNP